jgi:hypothetical protein
MPSDYIGQKHLDAIENCITDLQRSLEHTSDSEARAELQDELDLVADIAAFLYHRKGSIIDPSIYI